MIWTYLSDNFDTDKINFREYGLFVKHWIYEIA